MLSIEILVLVTSVIVVLLLLLKRYLAKRKAPDYLNTMLHKNEIEITEFEEFHGRVLVMDAKHKKLLFSRIGQAKKEPLIVDLSKILSCKIGKETIIDSGQPHMNKIELILKPKLHQGEKDIHVTLYIRHGEGLIEEAYYYHLAKKWAIRIDTILNRSSLAA